MADAGPAAGNPVEDITFSGDNCAVTLVPAALARGAVQPSANVTTSRRPTVSTTVLPFDDNPIWADEPTPGISGGGEVGTRDPPPDEPATPVTGRGGGIMIDDDAAAAVRVGTLRVGALEDGPTDPAPPDPAGAAPSPTDAHAAATSMTTAAPAMAPAVPCAR